MTPALQRPQDQPATDIYYIHRGPVPRYLLFSMENTRVFNPRARIFLIGDHSHSKLDRLEIGLVTLQDLPQGELEAFQRSYVHTSGNPEGFERFCFSRWFLLKEAMLACGSDTALHLDSDCMIFDSAEALTQRLLPEPFLCYYGITGNPHVALFRKEGIASLTKTLSGLFHSELHRNWLKTNWLKNRDYFCDMTGLCQHLRQHPDQLNSQTVWDDAVLEQTMSETEGYERWPGPKNLKRVLWREAGGKLIPYLKNLESNHWVRALALHYKGASKRRMRAFNKTSRNFVLRKLAKHWFNTVPPINLIPKLRK